MAIGDIGGGGAAEAEWATPIAAETVAAGSVGAAAGMAAATRAGSTTARRRGEGSGDARPGTEDASSQTSSRTSPPVDPPAPPAELTPPSPGGAAHLRLVREEPPAGDPGGERDPSGPEAA